MKELKQVSGVSVWVIGRPVDLLVGYRGRSYPIEIKTEKGKVRTPAQKKFLEEWSGDKYVCRTADDVLQVLGIWNITNASRVRFGS